MVGLACLTICGSTSQRPPQFCIAAKDDQPQSRQRAQSRTLHPAEHGLTEIGHMGFFRRRAQGLWPIALEWLERWA